ncbi:regulatory protein [Alkalithermobacter thermoalcaliphilus JW-YL-7 = DSM 7308]|uniref:Regulatory protein RecX n=1 Tax=Alkalithermobacter thermoalcaliphilus JW-YL-7 = DSM 7308 TaxID=1121328 RepID=A0A150FSX3_CLOPD|nr:Regulatory protein recX [[Clostridium] paradoxum JW-YL-7 = DSM 7308]SHL02887.1 regulatory protein [[Clostridium] paradoxum JW-YL-7 = DSM 7308]
MNKITKLEFQKNKERVNIYIDDKFFMGVYAEIIYSLNLKVGKEIDSSNLLNLISNEMYLKAKDTALKILSSSSQSEKNIRQKLLKKDFEAEIIDKVINFLKEYNFLNDEDLAKRIVSDNINLNKYGKNKIKYNLVNKGIDEKTISKTLCEMVDEDVEFENAMYLAKKKLEKIKDTDKNKVYKKLAYHLSYKGFDFEITKRVIKKLLKYDLYE